MSYYSLKLYHSLITTVSKIKIIRMILTVEPNPFYSFKDYKLCRFVLEDWLINNDSINENNILLLYNGLSSMSCQLSCLIPKKKAPNIKNSTFRILFKKFIINAILNACFWSIPHFLCLECYSALYPLTLVQRAYSIYLIALFCQNISSWQISSWYLI